VGGEEVEGDFLIGKGKKSLVYPVRGENYFGEGVL